MTDNPGGMGGTVPGAMFFGSNGGSGGMPSEAGGASGLGAGRTGNGTQGGNPLSQPLGSIFNYGSNSLMGQMVHYNNMHVAQARSMVQFANALEIGATIYVGGTLAPAGIYAGGIVLVNAGGVALNGVYYGGWYAAGAATATYQTIAAHPMWIVNTQAFVQGTFIQTGLEPPPNYSTGWWQIGGQTAGFVIGP